MNTKLFVLTIISLAALASDARSYSFKLIGSGGKSGANDYLWFQDKSKRVIGELTVGRPAPKDKPEPLEIRAASVFKDIKTRKAFINDIAKATFTSTNSVTSKVIISSGSAGKLVDRYAKVESGYDFSRGNTIAGLIVEVWQGGKCIKHLSNLPGKDGKTALVDGVPEVLLNEDEVWEDDRRERTKEETAEYKADGFKNPTTIKLPDGD